MFSVRVEWSDLENYLQREFKQEIVRVPGDGVCFLKSVKHCLERDFDVNYTIDQILDKIFDEICDNSEKYTVFHTNSKCQLISDTLKYLNHHMCEGFRVPAAISSGCLMTVIKPHRAWIPMLRFHPPT